MIRRPQNFFGWTCSMTMAIDGPPTGHELFRRFIRQSHLFLFVFHFLHFDQTLHQLNNYSANCFIFPVTRVGAFRITADASNGMTGRKKKGGELLYHTDKEDGRCWWATGNINTAIWEGDKSPTRNPTRVFIYTVYVSAAAVIKKKAIES